MPSLGTAYVRIRGDSKALGSDLNKAKMMVSNAVGKMSAKLRRMGFNAARMSTLAFGVAVVATAKKMVTLGREFESNMKTVQAWSGASGKSLQALTDVARDMGATTEWSANQAAGALKYLAAAGFSAEESIAALPGTLDLATAGQVDLASATDITTDVLTAFGLGVEELGRVNDAFITTTANSNTNVLMLGQSMKMVAPTAKLMGMSIEQTAAMLGTLADAGVKEGMAGSGLNMSLLRSAKAAKMLGMAVGAPLVDVLKKMGEAQWDATKIAEAFGARQVKTAGILMANLGKYEELTKKIEENKGATQELAKIVRDSLDNDLKVLVSTFEEQLLVVFTEYKGDMREMAQATTKWVQSLGGDTLTAIKEVTATIKELNKVYDMLPPGLTGAAGIGLIAGILGRSSVIGRLAFALVFINTQLKQFNLDVGTSIDYSAELADVFKTFFDVLTGKQDFNTGLSLAKRMTEEFDNLANSVTTATSDVENFGYAPNLPGTDTPPPPPPPGGDITAADLAEIAKLEEEFQLAKMERTALEIELESGKHQKLKDMEMEHRQSEMDALTSSQEYKIALDQDYYNQSIELLTYKNDVEVDLALKTQKILAKIEADKGSIQKATMKKAVDDASFFFKQMGEKNAAAFQIFKAIEIAKTVVNTYSAAMGAYNAMASIPYVGPALGIAAAAAAIASGFAQVQSIMAMEPGGGTGGGGSIGTYSASPATGLPTSVTDYDTIPEEEKRGTLTINIQGDILGDEGYIDMLVDKINAADDRDVFINQSLSARELT